MKKPAQVISESIFEKSYFVAWISFQRRVLSMKDYFKYKIKFISTINCNKKFKFFDYLIKSFFSTFHILLNPPEILWIQLPPTPLIYIALLYKKLKKDVILIADCHNGLFNEKWLKYLDMDLLNKFDILLVHNKNMESVAVHAGFDPVKVEVLEDKPSDKPRRIISNSNLEINTPFVLMPCSFAEDEPLKYVFEAAELIPKITIVISGNYQRTSNRHDISNLPDNVILTGFLSELKFDSLFMQANCIMGLTTKDDVQLSVANEAVGFEKPMILSDTKLLRDLFSKGAIYVKNFEPNSIAGGIKKALIDCEMLTKEIKELKKERNERWICQAEKIKIKIINLSLNVGTRKV